MVTWEQVRRAFEWDGALRDIYVRGAGIEHWQRALDALRVSPFPLRYSRSGVECELPTEAAAAFPPPDQCDRLLSVDLGGPIANAHFFTESEIEFDLDPSELRGQPELDAVVDFLRLLADATGLVTILTPEGFRDAPILVVRPNEADVEVMPIDEQPSSSSE